MKRFVPYLVILFVCVIFFYQFFFKGLLPIPSDTIVGLYNPFRDVYAKDYPRGVPYKNFLITDPVRQQYPWRELAINDLKKGILPLWNPYNFAGYPLLANIQSAVWYPLNILLFFLPFSFGWSLLIFLEPLLGGVFLYLYLRNLKIGEYESLFGVIAFIFSGFFISWLEWGTVLQSLLWLPLILLSVDKLLVKKAKWYWQLVFLFSLSASFFAGHWQTFLYVLCVVLAYAITQHGKALKTRNQLLRLGILLGIFLIITAIQWIPSLQFILSSAREVDQLQQWKVAGWFIPWQHLVQFIAPDFFGNPSTLNYWGVWNYGELVGYVGIIPLFFALYAAFQERTSPTKFFLSVVIVSLLLALPTGISAIPYLLHLPFLSSSQPTRLLGIIDFSLAVLAAQGLAAFLKSPKKEWLLLGILGGVFVILWIVILLELKHTPGSANWLVAKKNLYLPTVLFVLLAGGIIVYKRFKDQLQIFLVIFLLVITAFDLLRFGWKFTPFTLQKYLYPQSQILSYLQQQSQPFRIMTTDDRILPPNFSTHYHIESIDGYDPLYLKTYGEFIIAAKRNAADISSPFGFNRIITPHTINQNIVNLLGVKYVLSFDDSTSPYLKKIAQEGQTKLYENTAVLPRAFFITHPLPVSTDQADIQSLFNNLISLKTTATVHDASFPLQNNFTPGKSQIITYNEKERLIRTTNSGIGYLVITENYYPRWHVSIDGKAQQFFRTDYAFLGVVVPPGQHEISLHL